MADVVRGWEGTCCYSSLSHSLSLPPLNRAENNTREREGERGGIGCVLMLKVSERSQLFVKISKDTRSKGKRLVSM